VVHPAVRDAPHRLKSSGSPKSRLLRGTGKAIFQGAWGAVFGSTCRNTPAANAIRIKEDGFHPLGNPFSNTANPFSNTANPFPNTANPFYFVANSSHLEGKSPDPRANPFRSEGNCVHFAVKGGHRDAIRLSFQVRRLCHAVKRTRNAANDAASAEKSATQDEKKYARENLQLMLYLNLIKFCEMHYREPERLATYMTQSLLEDHPRSSGEPPAPTPPSPTPPVP
jgi:hypothetical protein